MEYINRETWSEYLGGSEDMFKVIGTSFLSSYENFEVKLTQAFNKNDLEVCLNEIHSLKGITLNLGMNELYEATKLGCEKIRGGQFTLSDMTAILDVFKPTYNELKSIIS